MKKFRNIPAIVTLLAGFVTSVIMIISKYSIVSFLWILVVVMVLFYVFGIGMRVLFNKVFAEKEEEPEETDTTDDEQQDESITEEEGKVTPNQK